MRLKSGLQVFHKKGKSLHVINFPPSDFQLKYWISKMYVIVLYQIYDILGIIFFVH